MPGEVDERAVIDDAADSLADDRRLHAVIDDLAGDAADRRKGRATSTGSAGHASAQANPKLTFDLDHSLGADQ
jgi:hypothetical protein